MFDNDEMYESAAEERLHQLEENLETLIEQFKQENGVEPNTIQLKELEEEADYGTPSVDRIIEDLMSGMADITYDTYRDGQYE